MYLKELGCSCCDYKKEANINYICKSSKGDKDDKDISTPSFLACLRLSSFFFFISSSAFRFSLRSWGLEETDSDFGRLELELELELGDAKDVVTSKSNLQIKREGYNLTYLRTSIQTSIEQVLEVLLLLLLLMTLKSLLLDWPCLLR